MPELQQTIRYEDLCRELKAFVHGDSSLSIVKDFFSVFWNTVHSKKAINDELIAQAEILNIAVEAYEKGELSREDLQKTIQHYARTNL